VVGGDLVGGHCESCCRCRAGVLSWANSGKGRQ
jgi:hypothetical protein